MSMVEFFVCGTKVFRVFLVFSLSYIFSQVSPTKQIRFLDRNQEKCDINIALKI